MYKMNSQGGCGLVLLNSHQRPQQKRSAQKKSVTPKLKRKKYTPLNMVYGVFLIKRPYR